MGVEHDHHTWPRERAHPFAAPMREDTTSPPLPTELAEALFQTTHALKYGAKRLCGGRDDAFPAMSMPRARLLAELWDARGTLRMSDVSAALGVTPRNVTTIVDGLEREDYIRRRRDPDDRRAIRLELTENGRALVERVHAFHNAIGEHFFAPLDVEERCLLLRLLRKLHAG
jgi:DNA-binding MarR family transcriptional regulator